MDKPSGIVRHLELLAPFPGHDWQNSVLAINILVNYDRNMYLNKKNEAHPVNQLFKNLSNGTLVTLKNNIVLSNLGTVALMPFWLFGRTERLSNASDTMSLVKDMPYGKEPYHCLFAKS